MSHLDLSNTLDLPYVSGRGGDYFDSMNSSYIFNEGHKYTDFELLNHPENFDNLESALAKIEKLSMQLEDCLSVLSSAPFIRKQAKALTEKTSVFKVIDPLKPAFLSVECRLSELYQFRDDIEKVIQKVESDFFYVSKLAIGKLNLELKVKQRDSPMINKGKIANTLTELERETKEVTSKSRDFEFFNNFFVELQERMYENAESFDMVFVKSSEKPDKKLKFVNEVENRLFSVYKAEEDTKLRELEWQIMTVNIKKSVYNDQLKKLAAREQELSKYSQSIRKDTLKNAKDRQMLEEEFEICEEQKIHNEKLFNYKVECINETLEMLSEFRFEASSSPSDILIEAAKSPKVMTDEIQSLEKQLKDLEYEFRNSKHPESLEALQTKITRIKSSILNYKSIQALQKTERTSSALRQHMNRIEKQMDNSIEAPSKASFMSSGSESSLKTVKKLPQHPLPASIRMSPLRKLEVPQQKFNFNLNEVRTPTRGKTKTLVGESPRSGTSGTSGSIRVLEVLLKEKEEELEAEEKKIQEMWLENLDDSRLVQRLQMEISEYRRKRDENFKVREHLERDKAELADRLKAIETKEVEIAEIKKEIEEQKQRFDEFKKPISDKLEWLKDMLIKDIKMG